MKNDETITCEMLTLTEANDLGLTLEEVGATLPVALIDINVDDFLIRMYAYQEC